jgi:hypothetical protein
LAAGHRRKRRIGDDVAVAENVQRVDLIAAHALSAPLQDHLLTIEAPVRLGVLATEGELGQLTQVDLLGQGMRVSMGRRARDMHNRETTAWMREHVGPRTRERFSSSQDSDCPGDGDTERT